jgi:hypothetical protein
LAAKRLMAITAKIDFMHNFKVIITLFLAYGGCKMCGKIWYASAYS